MWLRALWGGGPALTSSLTGHRGQETHKVGSSYKQYSRPSEDNGAFRDTTLSLESSTSHTLTEPLFDSGGFSGH